MPQINNNIEISNDDIIYAEKILLKEWHSFDTERRDFIKNLDTIDLQAVPWSWKTTALLAKLLILERKIPFPDWSGILVLSHTNTAVDEIKERIWTIAPKLFEFPNFIWTIQEFVNKFLAKPYYISKTKNSINFIDTERYHNLIDKNIFLFYSKINKPEKDKINHIKNWNPKIIYESYLVSINNNIKLFCEEKEVIINKPKWNTHDDNYCDYTNNEKIKVYKAIIQLKYNLMSEWNFSFEDAYFLWERYIESYPNIRKILQSRFRYIFVDEMQDMWEHQISILEKLFYRKYILNHSFQRIWDINQAIYWWIVKAENSWDSWWRKTIKIKWTHRLTEKIANVVKFFWLDYIEFKWNREIFNNTKNDISMKPILLVYKDIHLNNPLKNPVIQNNKILEKFTKIIKNSKDNGYFSDVDKIISKAIIWSATPQKKQNWTPKFELSRCRAKHYFYEYDEISWKAKTKQWFQNDKDYLLYYDKDDKSLKSKYNNIINLLLRILRNRDIKNINDKYFNKTSLLKYLKENNELDYLEFKTQLLDWSKQLNDSTIDEIAWKIDLFFPRIIKLLPWNREIPLKIKESELTESVTISDNDEEKMNIYSNNWIDIIFWTVHSVKWETHTCTLYLESSMHWNEYNKIKAEPYIGKRFTKYSSTRAKEAMKMLYVWLSRPTHLLCYAIHEDRYNELKSTYEEKLLELWDVEEVDD